MGAIRFGCQFYTWQMSGEKYVGKLPHICDVVARAGFAGIEPEICMMGPYFDDPAALRGVLDQRDLQLAALCLVCDWRGPTETDAEAKLAQRVLDYLAAYPGTRLMLCQMPGADRADLRDRQVNAIACVNAVAARAADRGVVSSLHPNSPPGSIFRTAEDYRILLDGLDANVVGYAPDSGHIAAGGMDPVAIFREYLSRINHVHFKDITADGNWAVMGDGVTDFPAIVAMLKDSAFDGWVMVEEESLTAETDPDGATALNGEYLRETLLPLVG